MVPSRGGKFEVDTLLVVTGTEIEIRGSVQSSIAIGILDTQEVKVTCNFGGALSAPYIIIQGKEKKQNLDGCRITGELYYTQQIISSINEDNENEPNNVDNDAIIEAIGPERLKWFGGYINTMFDRCRDDHADDGL